MTSAEDGGVGAVRMLGHARCVAVVYKSGRRFIHVEGSGHVSTMLVCGRTEAASGETAIAVTTALATLETAVREGSAAMVLRGCGSAEAEMAARIRRRSADEATFAAMLTYMSQHESDAFFRGRTALASALDAVAAVLGTAKRRIAAAAADECGGSEAMRRCTEVLDLRSVKIAALRAAVHAAARSSRIASILSEY